MSYAFGFIVIAFPMLGTILDVEARFLTGMACIALATTIAPAGRRIIVSILGGFWLFAGIAWLAGGILRPIIVPLLENFRHGYTFEFRESAWLLETASSN